MKWSKGGNAGEYADQWAGDKIRLPLAHTVSRGAGVTVAVLDTGIDAGHPLFTGRLVSGYDFVNMDADPHEEGAPETHPVYGHGTHVAGLVALAAPDARIMPIRVLGAEGQGNIWVLAEALAYAVDPDGDPNTNDGAHVINLSLSTRRQTSLLAEIVNEITCQDDDDDDDDEEDDDEEDEEHEDDDDDDDCQAANGRGAVVIAAAGNSTSTNPEYPAAEGMTGLLAIAATTASDTLATYSNFGSWIQVAAPGDNIMSALPGNDYGVWNGTSMATPLVAGQAALLRSAHPDWDAAAVTEQIVDSAVPIGGPVPLRIDAAAALNASLQSAFLSYLALIYR
jgi:subtilisin family serine protease